MISIYKNDWLEILHSDGTYIIRYKSGDHFKTIREIEVAKEDAMLAQESDEAAYRVILHYKNIARLGESYMNQ